MRTRLFSLLAVLLTACAAPTSADDEANPSETDEALSTTQADQRADLATQRLTGRFWNGNYDYLSGTFPGQGKDAGYWIFAQALDAVLDGVARTKGAKFKSQVGSLFDAQHRKGFDSGYFDDESWMTLALLRAHHLTGEARYLTQAEALMADIMKQGWDGQSIWWNRAHTEHATASNFGPVIAAARLYGQTGHVVYRNFAEKAYAGWHARAVDPKTHQVADHISPEGVSWWKFTYNQGLGIGAATAMYEMTHENTYLTQAHEFAGFMIAHETEEVGGWKVLSDGNSCSGDCDAFKGIGYRYLAGLYAIAPAHQEYGRVLKDSAQAIWRFARTPASTTFSTSWNVEGQRATSLGADASATMALNIVVGVH